MRGQTILLLLSTVPSNSLRIPFSSARTWRSKAIEVSRAGAAQNSCTGTSCGQLSDLLDLVYFSNITVGGHEYLVQLDTSSSDLWVNATLLPLPQATILKNTTVSNVYSDGANYTGPVAFANVEFHGYEVKNQSFTYVLNSQTDDLAPNLTGVIGLSFNAISKNDKAVRNATNSSTLGQTFFSHIFAANSSLEPFISLVLSREIDLNSTANTAGAFTIAEIEAGYEAIENTTSIPVFEASPSAVQWTIPVDTVTVGGSSIQVGSTVTGSKNKTIALLDTAASGMLLPDSLARELYGNISQVPPLMQGNAVLYFIPCNAAPLSVSLTFGGQSVSIHPLDLNIIVATYQTSTNELISLCQGSILGYPPNSPPSGYDLLLGDAFLRNAYTVFNFGSNSTSKSNSQAQPPFVKFLGITDPSTASSDFTATRMRQLALAPAADSNQVQQIVSGSSDFLHVDTPPFNPGGSNSTGGTPVPGGGVNGNNNGAVRDGVGDQVRVMIFVVMTIAAVFL